MASFAGWQTLKIIIPDRYEDQRWYADSETGKG